MSADEFGIKHVSVWLLLSAWEVDALLFFETIWTIGWPTAEDRANPHINPFLRSCNGPSE